MKRTRISIDENDPGYILPWIACKAKIYFNGYERTHIITADEKERYVVYYVLDEQGNIKIKNGKPLTNLEHGDVRIEFDEEIIDFII